MSGIEAGIPLTNIGGTTYVHNIPNDHATHRAYLMEYACALEAVVEAARAVAMGVDGLYRTAELIHLLSRRIVELEALAAAGSEGCDVCGRGPCPNQCRIELGGPYEGACDAS